MAIDFYCHNLFQQPKTTHILIYYTQSHHLQIRKPSHEKGLHSEWWAEDNLNSWVSMLLILGRWLLWILLILLHPILPLILSVSTSMGFYSLSPVQTLDSPAPGCHSDIICGPKGGQLASGDTGKASLEGCGTSQSASLALPSRGNFSPTHLSNQNLSLRTSTCNWLGKTENAPRSQYGPVGLGPNWEPSSRPLTLVGSLTCYKKPPESPLLSVVPCKHRAICIVCGYRWGWARSAVWAWHRQARWTQRRTSLGSPCRRAGATEQQRWEVMQWLLCLDAHVALPRPAHTSLPGRQREAWRVLQTLPCL